MLHEVLLRGGANMRMVSIGLIATLVLQATCVPCAPQTSAVPEGETTDQRGSATERYAEQFYSPPKSKVLTEGGDTETAGPDAARKRVLAQFLGGLLLSGAAAGLMVAAAAALGDTESEVMPTVVFGAPAAYLVTNSVAVYHIGKHFDRKTHGSYLATLGGTLLGFAAGAALFSQAVTLRHEDWALGLSALALLPAVGSVVGYSLSRPDASAVMNIQGGHVQWGIGTPTFQVYRLSDDPAARVHYRFRLVNVRF